MRRRVLGLLAATSVLVLPAAAARAADMAAPTPLALVVSGIVENWSGYGFIADPRHVHPDEDQFGSDSNTGRISLPLGTNFSIQSDVDIEYNSTLLTDNDDDGARDNFQLSGQSGIHASWRDQIWACSAFLPSARASPTTRRTPFRSRRRGSALFRAVHPLWPGRRAQSEHRFLSSRTSSSTPSSPAALPATSSTRIRSSARTTACKASSPSPTATSTTAIRRSDPRMERPLRLLARPANHRPDPRLPRLSWRQVREQGRGRELLRPHHLCRLDLFLRRGQLAGIDRIGATLDLPNFGRWSSSGQIIR